ncbi:hypothetical protein HYALB_00000087 [Hymenoscyphus albidus]|uniref:Zn(2)-C6 fungal-type domain-containing protein n=1 Tax=Hymenoscyphus albidus TaxID=595503 RepID=A0A9N9LDR3_9HELO|nr:hypothetical protein HYALB_00000087 [Hymenoscyphus albidus]
MESTEAPQDVQVPRPPSPIKAPRKRKRIVISCTECHRRKQKCDRASPCSNCITRGKQDLCHYENESARKQQLLDEKVSASSVNGGAFSVIKPNETDSDSAVQITGLGYAKPNGNINTTLGIFQKIEKHDADANLLLSGYTSTERDQSGLREKYKSLIRQLPSRPYIEKLLETYFREVNYQYFPLDEGIFRDHLNNWNNLSFATLNKGPLELPGDLQFFPALLFQCLALALQYQPIDYDPTLDALKYAAGMTFDDLANDYSESGLSILALLGKRHTTLVTVQASFLRTAYLKSVGLVTEAWHSLSSTIRDAQEIGLHKDTNFTIRKPDVKPEEILEGLWQEQLRRRMWLILSLWDIHMAIVLGRPTTIDPRDGKPLFPIDSNIPRTPRESAPSKRSSTDPPTPLTMLLWKAEISAPLWDIFNLEKEDPNQNNLARVQTMDSMIRQVWLDCPPYFRAQNPDTTFDDAPGLCWLRKCRPDFQNGMAFSIMALHRPYIFSSPSSRTSALKAALDVLRAQRALFNMLSSLHYKMFSLVLNTFDAIVLVAAIYILHPLENKEDLDDTLQHFEWGMERFEKMSDRNTMAKTALGILKAMHIRLKRTLGFPKQMMKPVAIPSPATSESYPNPMSNNQFSPSHHPSISSTSSLSKLESGTPSSAYTLPTISNLTSPPANNLPTPTSSAPPGWDTQLASFDFSSMAPLQPFHDLVYNDLGAGMESNVGANGIPTGGFEVGVWDANQFAIPIGQGINTSLHFEGAFGNDTFWGFMNNYHG